MATYAGQNYGAGLPVRVWQGVKSATIIMMVYAILMNLLLWTQAEQFALLFVDAHEVEILQKTALFIHVSVSFYPMLGMLCILRYTIQGVGYTSLAMLSGVSEMFARIAVSVIAVPLWGYTAVCFGDSMAWVCAVLFLAPAFHYVYRRMTRLSPTSSAQTL